MNGIRRRRAYKAALRRIEQLKVELFLALVAGDETAAEAAHTELIDIEHEARLIRDVARVSERVA